MTAFAPGALVARAAHSVRDCQAGGTEPDLPLALTETDDFVELFRGVYPRVVQSLRLAGAAPDTAEDTAQEALARTLRHWRRVRRGTNPAGYVYRVAFRLSFQQRRRDRGGPGDGPAATAGPEDGVLHAFDLRRALAAMPDRRRACAVMCLCLELSVTDAAEALKIAPGTVRKQLELARRDLRVAFAPARS